MWVMFVWCVCVCVCVYVCVCGVSVRDDIHVRRCLCGARMRLFPRTKSLLRHTDHTQQQASRKEAEVFAEVFVTVVGEVVGWIR
jgi:hypothetical protein